MSDRFNLQRFVVAQDRPGPTDNFDAAVRELRAGKKTSHWMWWVFPQMRGLGRTGIADTYGIGSREEATAYLEHDLLGPRLRQCAHLVVRSGAVNANTLMGGFPDDSKLQSSMTLFAEVAEPEYDKADFVAVLQKFYGGRRDPKTMRLLITQPRTEVVARQHPPSPKSRLRRWLFGTGGRVVGACRLIYGTTATTRTQAQARRCPSYVGPRIPMTASQTSRWSTRATNSMLDQLPRLVQAQAVPAESASRHCGPY